MVSLNRNRGRYSVTPILADLLKEPSGCFENFCRLSPHDFELTQEYFTLFMFDIFSFRHC
ncbi:hypothetical protein Avbf_02364 [Armadillidium vulgare]|nr:hypothetical protein Avbf_02364 [Armadillidium vulgare]